jgi:methionyl-tRNA formyltransferase
MRVVLLTTDAPAQRALARRIADDRRLDLVGVAVQRLSSSRDVSWLRRNVRQPGKVVDRVLQRLLFLRTLRALAAREREVFGDGPWPAVPRCVTDDVNGPLVLELIAACRPDAIAVSGTRMVRAPVFGTAPPRGLFNLHTGLSPYYKGGPNCTLWCLANGDPAHLGATVHVLDPGIDSGPLLKTVRTPVEADDTVADLVARTTTVGQAAYVQVLGAVADGVPIRALPQASLAEGRTYLNREWDVRELARAVRFVRRGGLGAWIDDGRPGTPLLVDVMSPGPTP